MKDFGAQRGEQGSGVLSWNSLLIRTTIIMLLCLRFSSIPSRSPYVDSLGANNQGEEKYVFAALFCNLNIFLWNSKFTLSRCSLYRAWSCHERQIFSQTPRWQLHDAGTGSPSGCGSRGALLSLLLLPPLGAHDAAGLCINTGFATQGDWASTEPGLGQLLSPSFFRIRSAYTPYLHVH